MGRVEILDAAESLFLEAGFHLSQRCCTRPSCFDFVARREKRLAFVKAQTNIGNIYQKDAYGLSSVARLFAGSSIFVCEQARNKPLEDDTIYSRYDVGAVTLATLKDALLRNMSPLIEAGPGGYYVRLDGEAVREKRLKKGLSIGKMAEVMGVSRRTLYGYERGLAKASVDTACKLEWTLGIPVIKPIDLFEHSEKSECLFATAKRIICESRFLQFVIGKLLQFNFLVFHLKRAPFDFIAKAPECKTRLLGAIACAKERNLEERTEEIISISKIVEAQPFFITDSKKISTDKVPVIHLEELEKIACPEDLMANF